MITAAEMNERANKYSNAAKVRGQRMVLEKAINKAASNGKFSIEVDNIEEENVKYFKDQGFQVYIEKSIFIFSPDTWIISWRNKA